MVCQIKKKEIYIYDGREFDSTDGVVTHIENRLGDVIDSFDVTLTPRQKLNILEGIKGNRCLLSDLLSVEVETDTDDVLGDYWVNVLDL